MSLINEALQRAKQVQAQPSAPVAADPALQPVLESPPQGSAGPWLIGSGAVLILLLAGWFLSLWWRQSNLLAQAPPSLPVKAAAPPSANSSAAANDTTANRAPSLPVTASALRTEEPATTSPASLTAGRSTAVVAVAPTQSASGPDSEAAPTEQVRNLPPAAQDSTMGGKNPGIVLTNTTASPPTPQSVPQAEEKPADRASSLTGPDTPLPELKLQGIFFRAVKSSALINGQTVFLGDDVEGAKVVAIERQVVRVLWANKTNVLRLH